MPNLERLIDMLGQCGMEKVAQQSDTVQKIEDPRDEAATPGEFSSELDKKLDD